MVHKGMSEMLRLLNDMENSDITMAYGALFLRLNLAALWAVHWYFKVIVNGMDATITAFDKMGYPQLQLGAMSYWKRSP